MASAPFLPAPIAKITVAGEYKAITHEIFHTLTLREEMQPDW